MNGTDRTYIQDKLPDDATIISVIISSDKTHLSTFSGDKSAWPVYLTIANIDKSTRRQASARANILIGYIPVSKLECFEHKKTRQFQGYQIFHSCMRSLLAPLKAAGEAGVEMVCSDGWVRRVHPILCAYVADYPEQCLVACNNERRCPRCLAGNEIPLGSPKQSPPRTQPAVLRAMADMTSLGTSEYFIKQGLRPTNPFWEELPH